MHLNVTVVSTIGRLMLRLGLSGITTVIQYDGELPNGIECGVLMVLANQVIARGLQHLVTFELVDYRDFAKKHPGEFDRIISCEMVRGVTKHMNEVGKHDMI